ncbi:MAG: hypothetical protein IPO67_23650 [Deltaproteobacteria bacterium]|nr:hypothetical protein [Deltaproteobacteria bacterium]MBK9648110.1 hypothetical protein [Deltaproteobacteria bacterium]
MRQPLLVLSAAVLLIFTACDKEAEVCVEVGEAAATVCVEDQHGAPFAPDAAYWFWPPDGGDYDGEHVLDCVDADCTVFGVPTEASGLFMVSATWSGPIHHDPDCVYRSFAEAEVDGAEIAAGGLDPIVVLTLDSTAEICD